mgnify:CR=1 FL=1
MNYLSKCKAKNAVGEGSEGKLNERLLAYREEFSNGELTRDELGLRMELLIDSGYERHVERIESDSQGDYERKGREAS